jgi:hypothetical protein
MKDDSRNEFILHPSFFILPLTLFVEINILSPL